MSANTPMDVSPASLDETIAFLSNPASYPTPTQTVLPQETHMSWVFLTDTEVWKLKKPVCFPPLDFSTLEARRINCEAEIVLNHRLAPDVYLGTHALTRNDTGALALDGEGPALEWLVRMRRLPEARMLDVVLSNGGPSEAEVDQVSSILTEFYRSQTGIDLPADTFVERYRRRHMNNRELITNFRHLLDWQRAETVMHMVERFLDERHTLLTARLASGRIVEGHGDLRAEHVCLTDPPRIIDCLEFDRDLRLVDPFEEITFLGLDCARLGAPWIAGRLYQNLTEGLGDVPPGALVDFYMGFHACTRTRIALRHLEDAEPKTPERWPVMAEAYMTAAWPAIERLSKSGGR